MRKTLFTLLFAVAVAAIASIGSITWERTSIDIGSVEKGKAKTITFSFKNDSPAAVQILDAKGSCGCTDLSYPKGDIAPGTSATIEATFKSSKTGVFKKNIRVKMSDASDYKYLYFSGEVVGS